MPVEYVTLVAQGGTPVRLANQFGTPYPTTGHGSLVFSDDPTLNRPVLIDPIINGGEAPVVYGQIFNGMSAANIREVFETFDAIDWTEQVTLIGNQTIDLSELRSKAVFSHVAGKPALITDASTGMIVGGTPSGGGGGDFHSNTYAPQFFNDWFLLQSGAITNGTRGIYVNPETYRIHWDRLWIKGFGGGLQGRDGEIRGLTIDKWACWNFIAFGVELFSRNPLKEVSEFFIIGDVEGNTDDPGADGIHFSFGPSCGSAGKIASVVRNGIPYRQAYGSASWDVVPITSWSWALGIMTITLWKYHSLVPGDPVLTGGSSTPAVNNMPVRATSMTWGAGGGGTRTFVLTTGIMLAAGQQFDMGGALPTTWNGTFTAATVVGSTVTVTNSPDPGVNTRVGTLAPHPAEALEGTEGKVIKIAMPVDPGTVVSPGWYTYSADIQPVAFNGFERPRKIHFENVNLRGQRDGGHWILNGTNVKFRGCCVDDEGVSDPYAYYCTGSWDAGTLTVTYATFESDGVTPRNNTLSPGDYFNVRLTQPAGYNASLVALSVGSTAGVQNLVTASMPVDPGAPVTSRPGDFYVPLNLDAHAWYYGPNAGPIDIEGCIAHENYGAAVYDDRATNQRSRIVNNNFFNQRYGFPNAPAPFKMGDIWCRPGRANMTITDNILGASDTWRFSSKSFLFSGLPAPGDYVWLRLNSSVEPTYFIFVAADPSNDSSQPEVLIGGDIPTTIVNLATAIHARNDVNCNAVQGSPTNAYLDLSQTVVADRLLIVRTIPGAVGVDYSIGESSANISLSPAGSSLSGGTGAATANYAIMNVQNGVRGNVVERNDMESHTDAETNTLPPVTVPVIRPNLLDNGDFSLDQQNEGAAVTINSSGATTGVPIVDRWDGNRSGTNITAQRVTGLPDMTQTYALQLTGAAGNTAAIVRTRLEGARGAQLVGRLLTMSCLVSSPTITRCAMRISYASALNNFTTDVNVALRQYVISTEPKRISFAALIPAGGANGLEASIRFTTGIGAGATVLIQEMKLEESGIVTEFVADSPENTLFSCQRYFRKTFPAGVVPAQNAGLTGAAYDTQPISGAVAQQFAPITFSPPMWTAPTTNVLYNPSAANDQIRNTITGTDWTASSIVSATANGIVIGGTGAAGGTAGDQSAVHYTVRAGLG